MSKLVNHKFKVGDKVRYPAPSGGQRGIVIKTDFRKYYCYRVNWSEGPYAGFSEQENDEALIHDLNGLDRVLEELPE